LLFAANKGKIRINKLKKQTKLLKGIAAEAALRFETKIIIIILRQVQRCEIKSIYRQHTNKEKNN